MNAMILCAGLGERFRPVTARIPKPLLPVMGKPLLHYALKKVKRAGVEGVVLNLHHLPDKIRDFAGDSYGGMSVNYSEEPEILGPVGGIGKTLNFFGGETFIVVNGDIWFEQELAAVIAFHKQKKAGMTMAVVDGGPPALRAVARDADGRVRQVWGSPKWEGAELTAAVNAGIYVYEPWVIERYVEPGVFADLSKDLMPKLFAADVPMFAFPARGHWADTGDPVRYLELHRALLSGEAAFPSCDTPARKGDNLWRGQARISPGAEIVLPCFFDDGCEVGDGAKVGPFAVLGAGCRVGPGARVEGSVVFEGVVLKEGTECVNEVVFESK